MTADPSAENPVRGRQRPGPKRMSPHPTATLLLDTTVELLELVPVDGVTMTEVLERSGVSQGSLYHHYADFPDLVEQAVVHRYSRYLRDSLATVRELLDATDKADFRRRAEDVLRATMQPERRAARLQRLEALGATQGRPRLVARLARAQQEITDEQAEHYREFQERGWLRDDFDALAMSTAVQALVFGRVIDDVAERPVDADLWAAVAMAAFRTILFDD